MKSFIKYAGGKQREMPLIVSNLPDSFKNLYDPFIGGGSTLLGIDAKSYFINDLSDELILFYKYIQEQGSFKSLIAIDNAFRLIEQAIKKPEWTALFLKTALLNQAMKNLPTNILDGFNYSHETWLKITEPIVARRLKKIGSVSLEDWNNNTEASLKAGLYTFLRGVYNEQVGNRSEKVALFVFIKSMCYSGMVRYNAKGYFNVPYGGIGYNKTDFLKKIKFYQSKIVKEKFNDTTLFNLDFEEFLRSSQPTSNDLIFLDPPYDTTFSTYDKNVFAQVDQKRLADYVHNTEAKILMIVKKTDFIIDLYSGRKLNIFEFDKTYQVNIMNRTNRNCQHLLIKNY